MNNPSVRLPLKLYCNQLYTYQLSRLRHESHAYLMAAHAYGPISHAWLKNVNCFQKYVNSDPCKELKPCVKWINDNSFLAISEFWSEKHWEWAHVYMRPTTSDVFRRLQMSLEDFWTSSENFRLFRESLVFKNPSTPMIKISCLYLRKSWQVYN